MQKLSNHTVTSMLGMHRHNTRLQLQYIGWAIFRLENVKEQRERRKNKAEKGKNKKDAKTLKHEKTHLLGGGVHGHF